MTSSSTKRRKLSPTAANPQSTPSTPNHATVLRDGAQSAINRPSFASPTKASIARHNPQLLTKVASAAAGDLQTADTENTPTTRPVESLFITPTQGKGSEGNVTQSQNPGTNMEETGEKSQAEEEHTSTATKPTSGRETRSGGASLSAPPRRRSRTPGKDMSKKTVDTVEGASKSTRRKETEPAGSTEKAITPMPFRSVGLRRSPIGPPAIESLRAVEQESEEPELPPTPTQRGLQDPVVTTPPSGIHNTPSKRPKRPRTGKAKPSPLKVQAEPEAGKETPEDSELERPGKRRKPSEYASRHLVPIDPHAEKKKLKDELLREVQGLQSDIALAEKENERLRRYYSSTKSATEPQISNEILDLLVRTTAEADPKPTPKPTSMFKAISSFLPFAPRPRPSPITPPKETIPLSHLPLKLEDQLPYLKLFTPLTYTSTITLLPPTPPTSGSNTTSTAPILQNHSITLTAPSGLFTARLNLTVDTSRFSISALSIPSLDPAAESELGPFVRERARGNGILGRDVSAICWAMARWYEAATRRAGFWCELERRFGTEEGRRRSNARIRAVAKRSRQRKGTAVEVVEGGSGDEDGDGDGDGGEGNENGRREKVKWTRKHLLPRMGRTTFVLAAEGVELRVNWDITFDWTGEAESIVSANARVPQSWHEEDDRGSLAKIPDTFNNLVKARGPMAAVRAMVALLMPS